MHRTGIELVLLRGAMTVNWVITISNYTPSLLGLTHNAFMGFYVIFAESKCLNMLATVLCHP